MTRVKLAVVVLLALIALGGVASGGYLYAQGQKAEDAKQTSEEVRALVERVARFQLELRDSQVEACERSGNPLRRGLREDKQEELHQLEHPDPAALKALHVSRREAIKLSRSKVRKLKRDIHVRFAPAHCAKQYPRP